MTEQHPDIARAIELCGTQETLAEKAGIAQQTISKLLNRQRGITGEIAARIDRATGGQISKEHLRPDLFAPLNEAQLERLRQGIG